MGPPNPLYKGERFGEEGEGQEESASTQVLPDSAPYPLAPSLWLSGRQLQFLGRPLGHCWIHGRDYLQFFPGGRQKSADAGVLSWALILPSPQAYEVGHSLSHLASEETEAQRDEVICPRTHC